MSIAGASATLKRLLRRMYIERHGDYGAYTFDVLSSSGLSSGLKNYVTLFLYRVGVDRTRRQINLPAQESRWPRRVSLGLELHYLLTVWGTAADGEQTMLGECMEILDEHAVISGDLLDPTYPWEPDFALKVSLETMSNEDMLRLWDSLEPSYQLSIPYLVRTVLLSPVERQDRPPVESRSNVWVPRIPQWNPT